MLVLGGALYLLSSLHMVNLPTALWTAHALWPLLLVAVGLGGAVKRRSGHRQVSFYYLFLALFGLFLFLDDSQLIPALQRTSVSGVFWSLVLIGVGVEVFRPGRRRHKTVKLEVNGESYEVPWKEAVGDWKTWQPKQASNRHWIGDVSLGSQPWSMEDMDVWNGIGDVRINLATAHLEDRTYELQIDGWIGDVRILVPENLPVSVKASVSLGDLAVFHDAHTGTGRSVTYADPGYDQADRRVNITVSLKIGDVQIVRV